MQKTHVHAHLHEISEKKNTQKAHVAWSWSKNGFTSSGHEETWQQGW
jgi:hypothetical protein